MYHSITFGDGSLYTSGSKQGQFKGTNTWEDWHLIPVTRPVIAAAKVFSKFVDIPGAHGTHDLSEYLTGHPIYKDRSGSLEFYTNSDDPEPWERLRARITNFLHGKKLKICLEDDPLFCWEGRFSFNEWKSEQICSKVVIDYVVNPFKVGIADVPSTHQLWDLFRLDTSGNGYQFFNDYVSSALTLNGSSRTFTLPVNGLHYFLNFYHESGSLSIRFGGKTRTLDSSNPVVHATSDSETTDVLTVSGTGSATIGLRERSL